MAKQEPERRCIVTGESFPPSAMLRFVSGPEGRVVPDIKGNLPGRGMWLLPCAKYVREAVAKKLFSRAAKEQVKADESLVELTEALLFQQVLNYLSRARIAGELVAGFEKVASLLKSGKAGVLIHAQDASSDGCGKLDKLAGEGVRILSLPSREILADALNLPNPVHMALQSGGLSLAFLSAYERWAGFSEKDRL